MANFEWSILLIVIFFADITWSKHVDVEVENLTPNQARGFESVINKKGDDNTIGPTRKDMNSLFNLTI